MVRLSNCNNSDFYGGTVWEYSTQKINEIAIALNIVDDNQLAFFSNIKLDAGNVVSSNRKIYKSIGLMKKSDIE